MALRTITLRGFKSIASLENFEMRNINLLIGANGSGKSNFLSAFKFLANVSYENLQDHVIKHGGPDAFLHGGRKRTKAIYIDVDFNKSGKDLNLRSGREFNYGYAAYFVPTASNTLIIHDEHVMIHRKHKLLMQAGAHRSETSLVNSNDSEQKAVLNLLRSYRQYHFHDTGHASPIKGLVGAQDNLSLKEDGQNIAAYLRKIGEEYPRSYRSIIESIRMVAPFFGDFITREGTQQPIQLEWYERGDPDTPYNAHALSDGTLRFICLTTLLLQPPELLPDTILIDEPELGLHPYAISLLAEMIKQVAETKQVVIATQSVELLNHFAPEDVVVADREGRATVLRRLNSDDLSDWLKSYSLGELWQKNVLGGRPV